MDSEFKARIKEAYKHLDKASERLIEEAEKSNPKLAEELRDSFEKMKKARQPDIDRLDDAS